MTAHLSTVVTMKLVVVHMHAQSTTMCVSVLYDEVLQGANIHCSPF